MGQICFPDSPCRLQSRYDSCGAVKTTALRYSVQMGTHHQAGTRRLGTCKSTQQISTTGKKTLYTDPLEFFNHIGERKLVFFGKSETGNPLAGRRVEGIDNFEIPLNTFLPDSHVSDSSRT